MLGVIMSEGPSIPDPFKGIPHPQYDDLKFLQKTFLRPLRENKWELL